MRLEKAPDRAKQYSRSKLAIGILKIALGVLFLAAFLLSGASRELSGLFPSLSKNYHLQLSGYLLVFSAGYYLLFLGLDFYGDVVLERRYGLSNQTTAGWLVRSAKEWGLSTLLVVAVLNLLYAVMRSLPHGWWLIAAIGWFVLLVLISKITPAVIVPLFYKMIPLQNSGLADRLLALAGRCGVRVRRVFEIKLSKETNKANAAVVGWGRNRRILIGDTLLTLCTNDEIEAVFAHELGHVALHHTGKLLAGSAASFVIGFYLLYLVLEPQRRGPRFRKSRRYRRRPVADALDRHLRLSLQAFADRLLAAPRKTGRLVHSRQSRKTGDSGLRSHEARRPQPLRPQPRPPRRGPLLHPPAHRQTHRLPSHRRESTRVTGQFTFRQSPLRSTPATGY